MAAEGVQVFSQGEIVLECSIGYSKARVRVTTHEVDIGKAGDPWPEKKMSSCTYSRFPCSVVDGIDLFVDGKSLFVPRSVFSDLSDLGSATLSADGPRTTLTMRGGDASEAYTVVIVFDRERVLRRAVYSSLSPTIPSQETVYNTIVVE
ncbi:hypothetical protein [Fundidesulfovibrio terrae]|uniref:hypothetical protein n=1 Tax=Fundidesulfovibrio terrae TaxID=2922866 RepID=UPI001FAFFACA|nr:hypothetical protein [Fundidesulfovibrio terrae]